MTQQDFLVPDIPIIDKKELKLLVSGSRTITDKGYVYHWLDYTYSKFKFTTIIEGEAGEHKDPRKRKVSVDLLAKQYAIDNNFKLIKKEAHWVVDGVYYRNAGIMRNLEMIKIANKGVVFWDGQSKGTLHALENLFKANKLLFIFLNTADVKIIHSCYQKYKDYMVREAIPYKRRSFE